MPTIRFVTTDKAVDFDDGDDVNLLRVAIRRECGVPYKCASGNCGTDRVRVVEGAENLEPARRRERETLGEELLAAGYRLACQTYVRGDVAVVWDPDQKALISDRAAEKLKAKWLSAADTDRP
jgi:ferredoxin